MTTLHLSLAQTTDLSAFGRALWGALQEAGRPNEAAEAAVIIGRYHDAQDYLQGVLQRYADIRVEWVEARPS